VARSPAARPSRSALIGERSDRGSSLVEASFVIVLLVMLLLGVLQIGALFLVRSVVAAGASDGARWAANADLSPAEGAARASQLIGDALSPSMAADVPCAGSVVVDPASGLEFAVVRCVGRIRSIFVPIGSFVTIDVQSRALREGSR
jgi:Flp pilus assembly protein TadG